MDTAEKVKSLIAKHLSKPIAEITEDKEIVKDLGADSLDVVEMLMTFEEEFGITLAEDDAANIKTIGDIIKIISEKKN